MILASALTTRIADLIALTLKPESDPEHPVVVDTTNVSPEEQALVDATVAEIRLAGGVMGHGESGFAEGDNVEWLNWNDADLGERGPTRLRRLQLYDLMDSLNLLPPCPVRHEGADIVSYPDGSVVAEYPNGTTEAIRGPDATANSAPWPVVRHPMSGPKV